MRDQTSEVSQTSEVLVMGRYKLLGGEINFQSAIGQQTLLKATGLVVFSLDQAEGKGSIKRQGWSEM